VLSGVASDGISRLASTIAAEAIEAAKERCGKRAPAPAGDQDDVSAVGSRMALNALDTGRLKCDEDRKKLDPTALPDGDAISPAASTMTNRAICAACALLQSEKTEGKGQCQRHWS